MNKVSWKQFIQADAFGAGLNQGVSPMINCILRSSQVRSLLVLMLACGIFAGSGAVFASEPATIEFLNSGKVLPKGLPFSEAVRVNETLYLSGQIGISPGTMKLVPGGIEEESRQTLENIKRTLEAHGYSMRDLVKCTVMLADMSEWSTFNGVYSSYFSDRYPARSAFGTNGLALGARVEVECIAVATRKR